MARKSVEGPETVTVSFRKRQHFWFDAGLVGLYRLTEKTGPVIDGSVSLQYDARSVSFTGAQGEVRTVLQQAYDVLVDSHYNLSARKRVEENSGCYYDSVRTCMVRFPKKKAEGIVRLFYDIAPRPSKGKEKWAELPTKQPEIYRIALAFLQDQGLNKGTQGKTFLLDGPSQLRPKQNIHVVEGKPNGVCFLCGDPSSKLEAADQAVYPMITGTSGILSFNSEGSKKPPRTCWKCSYVSKFVPAGGFYLRSDDRLHCFFPYSNDLRVMLDSHHLIHDIEEEDPNYFRNFTPMPAGYLNHANEVAFSFLFTLYRQSACEARR